LETPAVMRSVGERRFVVAPLALLAVIGCGGGGGGAPSGSAGATGTAGTLGVGGGSGSGGSSGAGQSGSDAGTGTLPPICGNQIVEGTETCDGARGCPDGQICADTCDACLPGYAPPPQTLGLIAAALAAGTIDYPTSLLLRGEALVADERLPPEYDGDFTTAEDSALFVELHSIWNNLTPAEQQMLLPYYVRPNDPQSVWSQPAPLADDLPDDMPPPPIACPENPALGTADWRYTESPEGHFVVWSCGGGDSTMDPYADRRAVAAALGDELWDLETLGLDLPREDDNSDGPDPTKHIDVYLLRTNEYRNRNGHDNVVEGDALAAASPASPCGGTPSKSSGFLMLRLERVPQSASADLGEIRADFAHELFHVISYGRNLQGQGGLCGTGEVEPASGSWLTEASGVWAEWAYTPADSPSYRTDQFTVYQLAHYGFRNSLLDTVASAKNQSTGKTITYNPAYTAYIYPVSLSADMSGKPDGFAAFWKSGTAGASTPMRLDDALDASFDFANHFRDFAVRDVNALLDGDPISPLFNSLDDAIMTGVKPHYLPPITLFVTDEDVNFGVVLMPLAFQVQTFTVPDDVRWVQVDASGADGSAHLALDALAHEKTKTTWTRRRPDAPVFTFCRDDMGDDIDQFQLVLSNTGHHKEDKIDSRYVIKTAAVCPSFLTGFIHSVRQVTEHDDQPYTTIDELERQVDNWTFSAPTGGATMLQVDAHWNGSYERHDTTVTTLTGPCQRGGLVLQTVDGTGSGGGTTPLYFLSLGPTLGYGLDLAGVATATYPLGQTSYWEDCTGDSGSTVGMNDISDPYAMIQYNVTLQPGKDQPNHFVGSATVLHAVSPTTGGENTIDWQVNWDVTLGHN
jgi:hypothetical protein